VRAIQETRDRIGSNIEELEQRLPPPAKMARRAAGVALGGGVGGTAFWFAVRKVRARRAKAKQAEANVVLRVLPDDFTEKMRERMEDGKWQAWLGGFAGAWLLIRLGELRQLRGLRRTLAVR
jgi:hypothetical protein